MCQSPQWLLSSPQLQIMVNSRSPEYLGVEMKSSQWFILANHSTKRLLVVEGFPQDMMMGSGLDAIKRILDIFLEE